MAAAALSASACSSPAQQPDPATVTVPALWAGETEEGELVGGVEQAGVTVVDGSGRFEVDLGAIEQQGAGERWTAATAVAAMVSTMFSGRDPRTVDLSYSVSGEIDGTSAGAILTVGSLAAIKEVPLSPGVTMTGTIAPDGTIGTVDGVPTKIKAAADAGFTTVLLPVGNILQADPGEGVPRDMTRYGRSLGVDVRPVGDLTEAYEAFTGRPLGPGVAVKEPPLSAGGAVVAQRTTESLAQRVRERYRSVRDELSPTTSRAIGAQVARVSAAVERRDWPTAYGLGVDTYQNIGRAAARRATATALASGGRQEVSAAMNREVDYLIRTAESLLARDTDATRLGLEQVFALPFAAGWYTYAEATLQSLSGDLRAERTPSSAWLTSAAPIVADQRAAITVFGPDAAASARRAPAQRLADPQDMASFIMGYSDFLIRAGDANMAYFDTTSVFGASGEAGDPATVAQVLQEELTATTDPTQPSLSFAMSHLASATSYYILSQTTVSGPSFGLRGFGIGADPTTDSGGDPLGLGPEPPSQPKRVLTHSVTSGSGQATARAASLEKSGVQPDYAIWQTRWGDSVYRSLRDSPRREAGGALALNEIWYAVIGTLMQEAGREVAGLK